MTGQESSARGVDARAASMKRYFRVAALQLPPRGPDPEENLRDVLDRLNALPAELDVVCLPELCTLAYPCHDPGQAATARRTAQPVPGPVTARLCEWARRHATGLIAPIYERDGDHRYNTAAVIGPDGDILGRYRKAHIPDIRYAGYAAMETAFFDPGDFGFPVFRIAGVSIGVLICWDRGFPEAWRCLRLRGAQVIFVPTAASGWRERFWLKELEIAAIQNGVFVVAPNRAGPEPGGTFFGGSVVISPLGRILASGPRQGAAVLTSALDLDDIERAAIRMPYVAGRRPELYAVLTDQQQGAYSDLDS